jgi:predicted XRE-type DNA-binding protein
MKKNTSPRTEKVLKVLEKVEKKAKKGEIPKLLPKNVSFDDRMKFSLCKLFVRFVLKSGKKAAKLSELIQVPKTRLSDILNYKTESYSVDRLLSFANKLADIDPPTKEHLNLMFEILDSPVRSVKQSRQIEKKLIHKYA